MGVPDGVASTPRSPRARSPRRGLPEGRTRTLSQRTLDQFTRRVTQGLADIEYFLRQPLGWRDGTAVVWAGMRGAVNEAERTKIVELMRTSADTVPGPDPRTVDRSEEGFTASVAHTLAVSAAQREALLDARDNGLFDADVPADALTDLDASEIAIELRSRHVD